MEEPFAPENISLPPSPPPELAHLRLDDDEPIAEDSSRLQFLRAGRRVASPDTFAMQNRVAGNVSISPRTRSPARYGSAQSQTMSAPSMQRAHSSPGVDSSGRFISPLNIISRRPASPLGYHGRRRSPLRSGMDDSYSYPSGPSWSGLTIEPNIPENEELDISSTSYSIPTIFEADEFQSSNSYIHNTFPRRRRPHSPLHASASAPSLYARAVSPSTFSGTSSPSLLAQRYAYEPYPGYSSASSMPSTPTSVRSRSPSISSLDTIEDSPDAEEAARLEEEEQAKVRASGADETNDGRRRSSLELRGSGLRSNKERKRWSVCGAERRTDFSLEPIEE